MGNLGCSFVVVEREYAHDVSILAIGFFKEGGRSELSKMGGKIFQGRGIESGESSMEFKFVGMKKENNSVYIYTYIQIN